MSNDSDDEGADPYADFHPVGAAKRRRSALTLAPHDDAELTDVDRFLAQRALNDIGNSERLVERFREDLMFLPGIGWAGWNGEIWATRDQGEFLAMDRAMETARCMYREAKALNQLPGAKRGGADSRERAEALAAHARLSGNSGRLKSMLELAQSSLGAVLKDLDADPFVLYTPNAALQIHPAEKIISRERAHKVTKTTLAEYSDVPAPCPKWRAFTKKIFPDVSIREFAQRAAGYSMTGDMSEESFFMCWGRGRNGKSTFLRTVHYVLGSYAAVIPVELLLEGSAKTGNEPSPQYAALPGVRFAMTTEPSPGSKFNEGEIKTLTGRDTIRIRGLYGTPFDFTPTFKLWIACNDRPIVRGVSDAYWRRVKLIPFIATISEEETNKNLERELREEAPGILSWLLEGRAMWAEIGLAAPASITSANQAYRDDMDPLHRFLAECTELVPGDGSRSTPVMLAYREWCDESGNEPLGKNSFGRAMANKGYSKKHSNGTVYRDLVLNETGRSFLAKGEAKEAAKLGRGW